MCRIVNEESGYTLVETLVAMVIFSSVLIPVGFGVATYLLDTKAEHLREALLLAEEAMSARDYQTAGEAVYGRYTVKTELVPFGTLIEYRVIVTYIRKPSRPLIVLSKIIQLSP
jgi:prepilin-type N-terminal cleavage/methylation domain-containing protein